METNAKKPIWKNKIVLFLFFIIVIFSLPLIFPTDYYKEGIDSYNKQNFQKALINFNNVDPKDSNYRDAISKIKEIKPLVDSLNRKAQSNASTDRNDTQIQPNNDEADVTHEENIRGIVGKSYDLGALTYKVERVKFKKFIGGIYTMNKADGVFLIITLTVTNKGKEQIVIDNSFFKLTSEDGSVYEYSPDGTATLELTTFPGETFMGMTINPHVSKKAKVVFEVPTKKRNYKLIFVDPSSEEYLGIDLNE